MAQANLVANELHAQGQRTELVIVRTTGDESDLPIADLGGTGVFTNQVRSAVVEGNADLAVHSLKDLPTDEHPELLLAAVPRRGPVEDVLVTRAHWKLSDLPAGARVGTGSLRRAAQLRAIRRDLHVEPIRGNVETRLGKVIRSELDAVILALAGLSRLGLVPSVEVDPEPRASASQRRSVSGSPIEELASLSFVPLSLDEMLPAVGQGALGLEIRAGDLELGLVLQRLDDPATHWAGVCERALLRRLSGGCLAPIAAWSRVLPPESLAIDAMVLSPDGRESIRSSLIATASGGGGITHEFAEDLGHRLAMELRSRGAEAILEAARHGPGL